MPIRSVILLFWLSISSCAIQVPPSGGDRDQEPPKLVSSVPENQATSFKSNELNLFFDEFIQLNNISSQLVISPPLEGFPEVKVRKKHLYLSWKDSLEGNTTYTFNFGNAIRDFNEGNILGDFQFVFSTGEFIDTAFISGELTDAFYGTPVEGALVMLYKDNEDSLPLKRKPLYFGRTEKDGRFKVRNIAPGSYKIFGLKDSNYDYLYNSPAEGLAFLPDKIPSGSEKINLRMFTERPRNELMKAYSSFPGKFSLVFSFSADTVSINWLGNSEKLRFHTIEYSENKDTISVWYLNTDSDTAAFTLPFLSSVDTTYVRLFSKKTEQLARGKRSMEFNAEAVLQNGIFQDYFLPLNISFKHPVEKVFPEKLLIKQDSMDFSVKKINLVEPVKSMLAVEGDWTQGANYNVNMLPGFARDIFGNENDTISFSMQIRRETDYGSASVDLSGLTSGKVYHIEFVNQRGEVVRKMTVESDKVLLAENLLPSQYTLRLIFDENKNGQWDTGSYFQGEQPEKVIYFPETVTVRANWDIELKWNLSDQSK